VLTVVHIPCELNIYPDEHVRQVLFCIQVKQLGSATLLSQIPVLIFNEYPGKHEIQAPVFKLV
jgi:hypothetical protein